jgi:cytochrome oxidase assembly protein ShyY1
LRKIIQNTWIRWLSWFVLASLFAASCVALASWQFERREQAVEKIQRVATNYEKDPVPLTEVLKDGQVAKNEWHPVLVSGEYLPQHQLLIRNRPIAGQPGFLQLVPFETAEGTLIYVERGWISADSNLNPSAEFVLPKGQTVLTTRIRLGELTPNRKSPSGMATSINLKDLNELQELKIEQGFYLRLISEQFSEGPLPQPLGKPILDEGNHLSYAVQWIIFAILGFAVLIWAIRQERALKQPTEKNPLANKRRRRSSDADAEDYLLDSN